MARKRHEKTSKSAQAQSVRLQGFVKWLRDGSKGVALLVVIPILVGLVILGVELFSEKPAAKVFRTEMPDLDQLIFYQTLFEKEIVYTNDKWNIQIKDFPPFDDPNPMFSVGGLPRLEIPITLINNGRKPTTIRTFRLTAFTTPPMVSKDGVILDDDRQIAESQSVFLDIGQEKKVNVQFGIAALREDSVPPKYTGLTLGHEIVSRGLMRLEITDIEQHTSSFTIEFGKGIVDNNHFILYWATAPENEKGLIPSTVKVVQPTEIDLDTNRYVIEAYVKAGAAYIKHDCLDCAFKYLDYVIEHDADNPDVHYFKGLAYEKLGEYENAEVELQTCLKVSDNQLCANELDKLIERK